jgi:hypothetical protein
VPGDCHLLPSGTLHALGAGVLVAEVQTPSDTTFRVYDWGREGRELHAEQALECIQWEPARDATRLAPNTSRGTLVTTGFFDLVEQRLRAGESCAAGDATTRPVVLMLVRGDAAELHVTQRRSDEASGSGGGGGGHDDRVTSTPTRLTLGQTVLIPAALVPGTTILAGSDATILLATPR